MNNSLSVEYALHSVSILAVIPQDMTINIKQLAAFMGLAPSYLAKMFTQLSKAGIVRSSVGSKGGIKLGRPAEDISFYDVFMAVNGRKHMFQCSNIRAFTLGYEPAPGMCEIHEQMWEAEEKMYAHLRGVKVSAMAAIIHSKLTPQEQQERLDMLRQLIKQS
ncbi:MAG: transcriptional regulator, BadM/Rrf2 family [Paenibacillus sp.]|nr:transcriptional regulator, BadM/Rrf2 family [Paenibacillus sp.]